MFGSSSDLFEQDGVDDERVAFRFRQRFSQTISSTTPPSRAKRLLLFMWLVAPRIQRRTSLEQLPPKTGRS